MEKVELVSHNDWSKKPDGDGLYKIKLKTGEIEYAVVLNIDDNIRIKSLDALWDSEPISHPHYEDCLFLGPLK